jgi:hypothetical protein
MKKTFLAAVLLAVLVLALPLTGEAGRTRVYVGAHFGFGHPGGWGPPAYPYGGYWHRPVVVAPPPPVYYYAGPPVIFPPAPPVYVRPEPEESDYWYYCENARGYYPYVRACPGGWMKVVPETVPPPR